MGTRQFEGQSSQAAKTNPRAHADNISTIYRLVNGVQSVNFIFLVRNVNLNVTVMSTH